MGLIQVGISMAVFALSDGPFYFSFMSEKVADLSKVTAFVCAVPYLLLSVWQFVVLLHRSIQKEFSAPTTQAEMKAAVRGEPR